MCRDYMFGWAREAKLFHTTTVPPATYGFVTPEETRVRVIINIFNEIKGVLRDSPFMSPRELTPTFDFFDDIRVQDSGRETGKKAFRAITIIEQPYTYNPAILHSNRQSFEKVILRAINYIYEEKISEDIDPESTEERNIDKEREENLRFYNQIKAELFTNYTGKYVVIAKGKLQKVGESFDEVKDAAMDANHRFIFKVEPPKERARGTLRWPMRKKK